MDPDNKASDGGDLWELSLDDLFVGGSPADAAAYGPAPYAIDLCASSEPADQLLPSIRAFEHLYAYQVTDWLEGRLVFRLRLGPIGSELEAEAILSIVRDDYPDAAIISIGDDDHNMIETVAASAKPLGQDSPSKSADPPETSRPASNREPAPKAASTPRRTPAPASPVAKTSTATPPQPAPPPAPAASPEPEAPVDFAATFRNLAAELLEPLDLPPRPKSTARNDKTGGVPSRASVVASRTPAAHGPRAPSATEMGEASGAPVFAGDPTANRRGAPVTPASAADPAMPILLRPTTAAHAEQRTAPRPATHSVRAARSPNHARVPGPGSKSASTQPPSSAKVNGKPATVAPPRAERLPASLFDLARDAPAPAPNAANSAPAESRRFTTATREKLPETLFDLSPSEPAGTPSETSANATDAVPAAPSASRTTTGSARAAERPPESLSDLGLAAKATARPKSASSESKPAPTRSATMRAPEKPSASRLEGGFGTTPRNAATGTARPLPTGQPPARAPASSAPAPQKPPGSTIDLSVIEAALASTGASARETPPDGAQSVTRASAPFSRSPEHPTEAPVELPVELTLVEASPPPPGELPSEAPAASAALAALAAFRRSLRSLEQPADLPVELSLVETTLAPPREPPSEAPAASAAVSAVDAVTPSSFSLEEPREPALELSLVEPTLRPPMEPPSGAPIALDAKTEVAAATAPSPASENRRDSALPLGQAGTIAARQDVAQRLPPVLTVPAFKPPTRAADKPRESPVAVKAVETTLPSPRDAAHRTPPVLTVPAFKPPSRSTEKPSEPALGRSRVETTLPPPRDATHEEPPVLTVDAFTAPSYPVAKPPDSAPGLRRVEATIAPPNASTETRGLASAGDPETSATATPRSGAEVPAPANLGHEGAKTAPSASEPRAAGNSAASTTPVVTERAPSPPATSSAVADSAAEVRAVDPEAVRSTTSAPDGQAGLVPAASVDTVTRPPLAASEEPGPAVELSFDDTDVLPRNFLTGARGPSAPLATAAAADASQLPEPVKPPVLVAGVAQPAPLATPPLAVAPAAASSASTPQTAPAGNPTTTATAESAQRLQATATPTAVDPARRLVPAPTRDAKPSSAAASSPGARHAKSRPTLPAPRNTAGTTIPAARPGPAATMKPSAAVAAAAATRSGGRPAAAQAPATPNAAPMTPKPATAAASAAATPKPAAISRAAATPAKADATRPSTPPAPRPAPPAAPPAVKAAAANPKQGEMAPPDIDSTQTLRALVVPPEEEVGSEKLLVVQLMLSEKEIAPESVPALAIFNEYRLYSAVGYEQGKVMHALRLGFFNDEGPAHAVAGYLRAFFDAPSVTRVSAAERDRFATRRIEACKTGDTGVHAAIELASAPTAPTTSLADLAARAKLSAHAPAPPSRPTKPKR